MRPLTSRGSSRPSGRCRPGPRPPGALPAQALLEEARQLLDTEATALLGESYERAYGAIVKVRSLSLSLSLSLTNFQTNTREV